MQINFCVIFNSFSQETKFNLFGSKEVFALSPVIDASILGTGVSLFVTDFILEKTIKQSSSNLQNKVFNKDDLSKLDKLFVNPYSKTLDNLGTVGSFALLASPLILLTEPKEEWFTIGTMYVESVLLAYTLKDFGKVLVNKPRPYMYNNTYPQKEIENGKTLDDVKGIIVNNGQITKEDFIRLANIEYENRNFNAPVINPSMYIIGNTFWMERCVNHYSGKEFWRFNFIPNTDDLPFITVDSLKDELCHEDLYNMK